jgi:transcriptional regulator GlxA family with amidase domain
LCNPRFDNLTVAAIGERWGLTGGASQISRLFRDRYGYPPSDTRRHRQRILVEPAVLV